MLPISSARPSLSPVHQTPVSSSILTQCPHSRKATISLTSASSPRKLPRRRLWPTFACPFRETRRGWHGCPEQLVGIAGGLAIDAQQRAVTAGLVDTGGGGTIAFALTRHL